MYIHLYVYMYVRLLTFCNSFFSFCALGTLWANYSAALPEKVLRSDKNMQLLVIGSSCCVTT